MIQPSNNFLMRYATAIAITAVTVLMLAAALIFYQQAEAGASARAWVDHTYEVKGHVQALLGKVEDAQAGQRGYMRPTSTSIRSILPQTGSIPPGK